MCSWSSCLARRGLVASSGHRIRLHRPSGRGRRGDPLAIDGLLTETAWATAEAIESFTQTDPSEGAPPSARTTVRVLAGPKAIVIGVDCEQPPEARIVKPGLREWHFNTTTCARCSNAGNSSQISSS